MHVQVLVRVSDFRWYVSALSRSCEEALDCLSWFIRDDLVNESKSVDLYMVCIVPYFIIRNKFKFPKVYLKHFDLAVSSDVIGHITTAALRRPIGSDYTLQFLCSKKRADCLKGEDYFNDACLENTHLCLIDRCM